jgi:MYXO-CTERM domain-containing protein
VKIIGPRDVATATASLATLASMAVLLSSGSAHAAQVVVADVNYTHSAQTTTDSHYRVPPATGTPTDWTSPVAYSTGSAHVRLEVRTKPNTTTETTFQVCFEATQNYGCTDISRPYTVTGLYEWDTPFARFFTPGPVPWERGILRVAILLKDTRNVKPAPENVGAATSALYMPTDVHVTVTIVSAGSTFQPPAGTAPVDAGGVGANPRDAADAGPAQPTGSEDAASLPDARSPSPVQDSGLAESPAGPIGSGGVQGTSSPPAAAQDAASVVPTPPSTGQGSGSGGGPGSGKVPSGQPSAGSNVSGSGCSVASRDAPADMVGVALAFALALAPRRRRRLPGPARE